MQMPGRNGSTGDYRYGFNGMEGDGEIKGSGNSYDFGARIYDTRIGRWLATDPHASSYPNFSPYSFAANNPVYYVDPDGNDIVPYTRNAYAPSVWEINTFHDLGAASPLFIDLSTTYDASTGEVDIILVFTVTWHPQWDASMMMGGIEAENPGLREEVALHEGSHVDQFNEAAARYNIMVTYDGETHVGKADDVMEKVYAHQAKVFDISVAELETKAEGMISGGYLTNAEAQTWYDKSVDELIVKLQTERTDVLYDQIAPQLQENIMKEYNKPELTGAEIQEIENDANARATVKAGGEANLPYIYGQKKATQAGTVIPPD
jgi:RHS repeat-associated protein